jgi:cobalamin biosynthesis protein CbiG
MKATKKQNKRRIYIDGQPMKVEYAVYQLLENQKLKIEQYEAILAAYLKEKEEANGTKDND